MNSMLISGFQSHSSLRKLHRHDVLEYTTYIKHDLLQLKVQFKTSYLIGVQIWPHEKEVPSGNHCLLPLFFLCFFEKDFQLYHQLLMTESKPCSTFADCHMTKHVTSKGPKSTLLPENEIILVSSFQIWYLHNLLPQSNTYCKKNTIF